MKNPLFLSVAVLLSPLSTLDAHEVWVDRTASLSSTGSSTPTVSTYAGGRFLLFGSGSVFRHSAAGAAAWATGVLPNAGRFYDAAGAATDGTTVVVSGSDNLVHVTSADQIAGLPGTQPSWTVVNPANHPSGTPDLYRVRHLNGQFILGGRSFRFSNGSDGGNFTEVLTSADGLTWTSNRFTPESLNGGFYDTYDFAFKPGTSPGGGTYVISLRSANGVLVAPEDLSSASYVDLGRISSSTPTITYAAGTFVLASAGGILTSPTGQAGEWANVTLPVETSRFGEVIHDGTRFIAVGDRVTGSDPARPIILHSTDAVTWTEATTVPASTSRLNTVLFADGLHLAAGTSRVLFTSGSASVSAPEIEALPAGSSGIVGGDLNLTATVTGSPAPTFQWLRNGQPLADGVQASGATVAGSATTSLSLTGLGFGDAGLYALQASNSVSTTTSTATTVAIAASAGGAVLTPYGLDNSQGGIVIRADDPITSVVGTNALATFTADGGLTYLPNVPSSYSFFGAVSPSGASAALGNPFGVNPPAVYDFATQTATILPAITGPITSAFGISPSAISDNGDVGGTINTSTGQLYAFHFSAATQTYSLLGNVPNPGNEIATSIGGITSDGALLSGYERNGAFNGPFVWSPTNGFTLLPSPANGGFANGDVRQISPDGRFVVGFGATSPAYGSGQSAIRWDLDGGEPVGFSLAKTSEDTFADARSVNSDGLVGGNVRRGFSFNDNRAAVWLPSGALIVLDDYLLERYGLDTTGFTLNQVTSVSSDRRVITGTATNLSGFSEGWLLTLPDPIDLTDPEPLLALRVGSSITSGSSVVFGGETQIGGGVYPTRFSILSNQGANELNVSSVSISGVNAADFQLTDTPDGGLVKSYAIGDFESFRVTFEPQPGPAGPRTAVLTVNSNDPTTPAFTVQVSGNASAPPTQTPAEAALEAYLTDAAVPENLRGPDDDPDRDGISNLLEFALGLPPLGQGALPAATNAGGVLSLTYTQAQPTHVNYVVTQSTDLGVIDSWDASGVDQGTPDVEGETTATIPIAPPSGFLRIEVALKP